MDFLNLLAIVGLIVGVAYLVLAAIAANRSSRRLRSVADTEHGTGRVMLGMEYVPMLVEGEPTDDRMHKLAAIFASTGQRVFKEEFDFSVESIARLDRAIVIAWGDPGGPPPHDVPPQVLLSFGAYVGEVLVRRTRGRWVSGLYDADPANVLFLSAEEESVNVSPFLLVRQKFTNMYGFDLSIAFTALEQRLKELNVV